jgi:hypothetical protein
MPPSLSHDREGAEELTMAIVKARYDDSYPFMHLAQRHGVAYGDVLIAAEFNVHYMQGHYPDLTGEILAAADRLPEACKIEIVKLCSMPVAERGGRHEYVE